MKGIRLLLSIVAALLLVSAVLKELGKEPGRRTGHGTVADVVPYDFRPPSWDRLRAAVWNPDGPLLAGTAFGVGWTINLGRLARLAGLA